MKNLVLLLFISPILFSTTTDCTEKLPLNAQIISFVKSNMNKKVGTGECWDLASEALNQAKAKWNGELVFGTKLDYQKECIYPGDIVQFEGVKLKYIENKMTYVEAMEHHTAIIYEVKGIGDYTLAHQNTAYTGRKVGTSKFNVKDIISGTFTIYRPVKQ